MTRAPRPRLRRTFAVLAWLLVLGVVVQAVMAGQYLYGSLAIVGHGHLGNTVFAAAVAAVVVAAFARLPRHMVLLTAGAAVLMVAQIGLGYSARESLAAGGVHLALGVALAAWLAATAALASRRPQPSSR